MALGKCKECGEQVSSKADKCPHCGAPAKKSGSSAGGCLVLIIVVVVGIWVLAGSDESGSGEPSTSAPSTSWETRDNSTMAYIMMEDFVKRRLKAPSTAKFQGILDGRGDAVTRLADHAYRIDSYVDAQNGFGAQIRNRFRGEIKQTSDRGWHLQSLTIDH